MCGLSQKQIWRRQSSKGKSAPLISTQLKLKQENKIRTQLFFKIIHTGKLRLSEASLVAVADDNKEAAVDADVVEYHAPAVAQPCPEPALEVAACEIVASSSEDSEDSVGCAVKKACASAKEVSFSGFVKVMLIPCIVEYKDAGLCDIIWWTPADMNRFKVETILSVQKYMMQTQIRDIKQALRMLLEDEAVTAGYCV